MSDKLIEETAHLFSVIASNAEAWLRYWSDITLHPMAYAKRFYLPGKTAMLMFVINNTIGFAVFLLILSTYWAIFFTNAFRGHWQGDMKGMWFILSSPFFFAIVSMVLVVVPGLMTYAIVHLAKAKGNISGHISRALACSNMEWITASLFAITFILKDPSPSGPDWQGELLISTAVLLVIVRLYYAFLQTILMSPYHYKIRFSSIIALVTLVSSAISGLLYGFIYFILTAVAVGMLD